MRATFYKDGDYIEQDITVRDSKPEVDGDTVDGDVFSVDLTEDIYVAFDIEQARAFIEACQEILSRYDK